MPTLVNLSGQRFGRWTVLGYVGRARWKCLCDCGSARDVAGHYLKTGVSRSCGCLQRELLSARARTHGMKKTPEYRAWSSMRSRCLDKAHDAYKNYGGRGITICERWNLFQNFFADMGPKPSPKHSLDRYPDNNGNYEPGNVRWATLMEQELNRRTIRVVEFNGKQYPRSALARLHGVPYRLFVERLEYGWPVEKALSTPVRPRQSNKTQFPTTENFK